MQDMDAVIQVTSEGALLDQGLQWRIRRTDQTKIHRHILRAAHRPQFLFFEDTQQLGLQTGRHCIHFVEEQCAAIRFAQQASMVACRARECPTLVAEQFSFGE